MRNCWIDPSLHRSQRSYTSKTRWLGFGLGQIKGPNVHPTQRGVTGSLSRHNRGSSCLARGRHGGCRSGARQMLFYGLAQRRLQEQAHCQWAHRDELLKLEWRDNCMPPLLHWEKPNLAAYTEQLSPYLPNGKKQTSQNLTESTLFIRHWNTVIWPSSNKTKPVIYQFNKTKHKKNFVVHWSLHKCNDHCYKDTF